MSLVERLEKIRHDFETGETPRETVTTLNNHVDRLVASNVIANSLAVGSIAPIDLKVVTRTGAKSLIEFFDNEFLILTWFRGNW